MTKQPGKILKICESETGTREERGWGGKRKQKEEQWRDGIYRKYRMLATPTLSFRNKINQICLLC